MASNDIFGFLNDVYDLLPERDQDRFGELWKAYEQTYGHVWMTMMERKAAATIDYVPLYNNLRWLNHVFNDSNKVLRAATYRTNQDVSKGLDLSIRYLIKFSIDGGSPIEVDLRGNTPTATTNTEIVTKINTAAGFRFATLVVLNALIDFTSSTKGPTSSITFYPASTPAADASAIILGLDPGDLPITFPKFPYEYLLGDKFIVAIPTLQDKIIDEKVETLLTEGVDYEIEFGSGVISFDAVPPASMWAKDTLVNLETPYNNFGFLMDLYDTNTENYLKAVKGLWFAFWTGPRPENIRTSLYLLFGLPTATLDGTVTAVSLTEITLTYVDGSVETFAIPTNLVATVTEGQQVSRFTPLVDGIQVFDKINRPGFLRNEVGFPGVEPFLTENATLGSDPSTDEYKALFTIEENSYLPQINVDAFISPDINLRNVRTFLKNIQPKSRTFLFQVVVGIFRDELVIDELLGLDISLDVTPNVDSNPNTFAQQSDLDDAETNDDTGIVLDGEVVGIAEYAQIDVYESAILVDSFMAEG